MNIQRKKPPEGGEVSETNKWRFIERMKKAGYTQGDIAQHLGTHKNTISNKLNGRSEFTIPEIKKLCVLLNITESNDIMEIFIK